MKRRRALPSDSVRASMVPEMLCSWRRASILSRPNSPSIALIVSPLMVIIFDPAEKARASTENHQKLKASVRYMQDIMKPFL